jgi:hypothetical protein
MNDVQRQPILAEDYAGFTADDFSRMLDVGAFSDMPGKIELVDGVIARMSPAQNPHFSINGSYCGLWTRSSAMV